MDATRRRTTLADVARDAGVAKSTASLAFSMPSRVSPETVARVIASATGLGYSPNPLAQSLKSGRGSMIGLLVNDMRNPLSGLALTEAQRTAFRAGRLLMTSTSESDPAKELEMLHQFARMQIKGVVLTSAGHTAGHVKRLRETGLSFVTLDLLLNDLPADHVGLDNAAAAGLLTRHLLDRGHRRIAHITGGADYHSSRARMDGVVQTIRHAGVSVDEDMICHARFDGRQASDHTRALMARGAPPTAIVAANSVICARILETLDDLGLDCPNDVSVVSIDELPLPRLIKPRVTCIVQPFGEMAQIAVNRIVERQAPGPTDAPDFRKTELVGEFREGNSVRTLG